MNQFPPPELMEPQWFLPFFALMWSGICALLAVMGGWSSLATQFRAIKPMQGKRFRFISGSMGARFLPVSYGGCLFITINDDGFGVSIFFPFRLMSPPLFFPWRDVESVEAKRFLFIPYTDIRVRGAWPTISLRGPAGKQVQSGFARSQHRQAQ